MKKVVVLILTVLLVTANLSAYVGSAKAIESAAQVAKFLESLSKQGKGGETVAKGLFQEFKTLGIVFKSTTVNGMIKELGTNPEKAKIARAHLLSIEGLNQADNGEIVSFIRSPEERMDAMVNSMISRISQKVDGEFSALCNGKIKDTNGFAPIARDLAEIKGVNLNKNLQASIASSKINMGMTEVINLLKQERMLQIKISQATNKDSAKNLTSALSKLLAKKKSIPQHIIDAAYRVDMQNTMAHFSKEAGLQPTRFAEFWAQQYEDAKRLLKEGFPESVKKDFAEKGINPSNYTATQLTNELMSGLWKHGSLFMDAQKAFGGLPTVNQIKELAKVVDEPGFDRNLQAFKGFLETIIKPGGNKLTAQDRENIFSCMWSPRAMGVAVR
jgi:hypothetical protein